MIVCSNCSHENMSGAVFCSECGAPLQMADALTTQNIKVAPEKMQAAKKRIPTAETTSGDNWITLHLLDSGHVLPLAERNEFTMGRSSEGQPIMPDIDLAPFQGYARGVSRLHAVIRRGVSDIMLMDLESANGTFINGKKIEPNVEEPLANGDIVALGKLKIQVLLKGI
jgi:pSer/pThr/pTyr-binding forkhead associated (FHA) protein